MHSSQENKWYRSRDFWFRVIELSVIICATFIAWRALERNTEGIRTSTTSKLYDADAQVAKQEFDQADKPLWSIYGRPNTTEPTAYCQQLLASIAKQNKSISMIPDAESLYAKIVELNPPADEIQDIAELSARRKVTSASKLTVQTIVPESKNV